MGSCVVNNVDSGKKDKNGDPIFISMGVCFLINKNWHYVLVTSQSSVSLVGSVYHFEYMKPNVLADFSGYNSWEDALLALNRKISENGMV
jgi:hypothetical protein